MLYFILFTDNVNKIAISLAPVKKQKNYLALIICVIRIKLPL